MTGPRQASEFATLAGMLAFLLAIAAAPVPIIFDTDMASDCDDVAALVVLHVLADRGEATVLATVVNRGDAAGRSASATAAINTFYGRPDLPIGVARDDGFVRDLGRSSFTEALHAALPHTPDGLDPTFPDAVAVYRRVLGEQPDGSVTICSVGALSNLAGLLESDDGPELVAAKVRRLVVMGGGFPRTHRPETNLLLDAAAALRVANDWPTETLWQGYEVGAAVIAGDGLRTLPATDLQRLAFSLRPYRGRPALEGGKPSHDQAAVLLAVRGPGKPHWSLSPPGRVVTDSLGNTEFHVGRHDRATEARHRYVRIAGDPATLAREIETLMLAASPSH